VKSFGAKLLTIFLILGLTPANAATKVITKPITVTQLVPTLSTNFASGDDLSQLLPAQTAIYLTGTIESNTVSVVSSALLGGTDGYLVSLDATGKHLWDLRLGTTNDDLATTMTTDSYGNIWVAGASTIPTPPSTPSSTPAATLNPAQVNAQPVTQPPVGFQRILVWEITSAGVLLNTYSTDFVDVAVPSVITLKNKVFTISGFSTNTKLNKFSLTMSATGKFGVPSFTTQRISLPSPVVMVKSPKYTWQSFLTTGGIQGVSGFKPKTPTSVLIKSSLKSGAIASVYSFAGTLISMNYLAGTGIVLATTYGQSEYITIIHTS
jgi:hypothetical protein